MATSPPVRGRRALLDAGALLSASSTLALSGTLLAAAQALVGGDDELRSRSPRCGRRALSGEKPPKTTEWTAPMRAQASIA
jgi:hypothetical protein